MHQIAVTHPVARTPRRLAAWAAAALLVAALSGSTLSGIAVAEDAPAFAGAAEIRAGDTVKTSIAGLPGEVHQYRFFALKGARISARVRAQPGTSLLPTLRLTRPGGAVLADGRVTGASSPQSQHLAQYEFPYSGFFVLEVAPRSGAGGYVLRTRARGMRRLSGLHPDPGSEGTWRFDAPAGTALSIRVRAPRRWAGGDGPRITGLDAPSGADIPLDVRTRGQLATAHDVLLSENGTYTLHWWNPGGARRLRFAFLLKPLSAPTRVRIFPTPQAISPGAPEPTNSALGARQGYVGSATCGRCHDEIFTDWTNTPHHLGAREWQRAGMTGLAMVNDANRNGRDDFHDGRDLAGDAAFAAFAGNAPKLTYVAADPLPYKVTVGAVTYDVAATAGGNGIHQQSYLARIGGALYPLPFEYDELRRAYAPLDADLWYDGGGAPLYAAAAAVPADASYEARCAGCHATGLVLQSQLGSEILAGFVESGVGCEQCHGPGAAHAASGDPALVQNPRALLDGTPAGVARANDVCARCHDRGDAVDTISGTSVRPPFGYQNGGGVAQ